MYQSAQQSTWLTILILIKLQNHILQFQDIFCIPSLLTLDTGRGLFYRTYKNAYISHFMEVKITTADNARWSVITSHRIIASSACFSGR